MKQEDVAGKIVAELWSLEVITEEDQLLFYDYLMQAYAAGYDAGRKVRSNQRAIAQYLDDKLINIFDSAAAASRNTKTDHADICRCANGKLHTAGGYTWKWVNQSKSTSQEQTVGTSRSQ